MSRHSHYRGADKAHDTFLVILKVIGKVIHLWPQGKMQTIGTTHSFRIACHNVETHSEHPGSDIQILVLSDPPPISGTGKFMPQPSEGEIIDSTDLVMFMTGPVASSRRASYAIDLSLSEYSNHTTDCTISTCEKIGTAYIYLDPGFSTQGTQKLPIIETQSHAPIGQIQVDYLIVTNPIGYGIPRVEPDWLFKSKKCLDSGHRGCGSGRRSDLPENLLENTLASFNYAFSQGADMCEMDVLVTDDGVPVVYHDFDVDAVTAQQSSEKLGKFRIQVDEFTMQQLKDFRLVAMSDKEGHPFTLAVAKQAEENKPFPSLEQVLNQLDKECGLNIEVKWPQLLVSGRMEARKNREINDFVDRIIEVVSANARNRHLILESFDPDIAIMLRLKQTRFPVIFLSQGLTERYEKYSDTRSRSVRNAVYFAQAFDFAGIDLILDYYVLYGKQLVNFIKDHGLVARAWGELVCGYSTLNYLKSTGLQCITYDKVDLMMKQKKLSQPLHNGDGGDDDTSNLFTKQLKLSQSWIHEQDHVGVTG